MTVHLLLAAVTMRMNYLSWEIVSKIKTLLHRVKRKPKLKGRKEKCPVNAGPLFSWEAIGNTIKAESTSIFAFRSNSVKNRSKRSLGISRLPLNIQQCHPKLFFRSKSDRRLFLHRWNPLKNKIRVMSLYRLRLHHHHRLPVPLLPRTPPPLCYPQQLLVLRTIPTRTSWQTHLQ